MGEIFKDDILSKENFDEKVKTFGSKLDSDKLWATELLSDRLLKVALVKKSIFIYTKNQILGYLY